MSVEASRPTATRFHLGLVTDIPKGEGRSYEVATHSIAVFRTRDGRMYATQAKCPHKQGPLADGLVGADSVVCPLHEKRFDLASGCEVGSAGCSIATYKVLVDASEFWVEIGA